MSKRVARKLAAFLIVGVMVLQLLPMAVGAQEFKQGRVVADDFNTFTSYTSATDEAGAKVYPKGFKASVDGKSTESIYSYADAETGTTAFQTGYNSKTVYSFPEAIVSGKLRVSFDVKTSNNSAATTDKPSLWIRSHYTAIDTTQNVDDYYYHLDQNGDEKDSQTYTVGERMMTILRVRKDDLLHYNLAVESGSTSAVTEDKVTAGDGSATGDGMVGDGGWHKVDAIFDLDNKLATLTYDGITIYQDVTIPGTGGLKDLFLLSDNSGEVVVDNWYVNHYFDEADNKALMSGEYDPGSNSLTVTFSENVARALTAADFTVTNAAGTAVTPASVTNLTNSSAKLTFEALESGVHTVVCNESFLTGSRKAENTVEFAVTGTIDYANDAKYFINESFDGYAGGMPVDWYALTDEISAASLTATEHGDGKALSINSNNTLAYDFKSSLMNGVYDISFDVKNGSGWYMHLLDTAMTDDKWCRDNATDWVYQDDYNTMYEAYKTAQGENYTNEGWDAYIADAAQDAARAGALKATKKKTVVVGQEGNAIKWNKNRAADLTNATALTAEGSNEWTTVRVTLDFNNGSYNYKIGDAESEKVTFASLDMTIDGTVDQSGTLRYDRIALVNHETKLREFVHGVGGIAFTAVGDEPLEIDNVYVYSSNSYNLYEDFNTVQANGIIRRTVQPGWYDLRYEGYGKYGYTDVNSTAARNIGIGGIDAAGKGAIDGSPAELISTANRPIVGLLETPIPLGKQFTIELDWYYAADGNILYVGIVNEANTYSRAGNTKTASTGHPATGETPSGADALYNYATILRACKYGFSYWRPHASSAASTDPSTVTNKKLLEPVAFGVWHLKYDVKTSSTGFEYKLTVSSPDGATKYESDWVTQVKMSTYTMDDIVGISFGGSGSYIDNIKVYEAETPVKAEVLGYTVTDLDGTESALGESITDAAKSVRVDLSSAILNTDGITVKYTDGTDVVYEKVLSADNKSVDIVFTEAPQAGKTITIGISQYTETDGVAHIGGIGTTSKSFDVTAATGGIVVTDFRIYEKLGGNQLYFNYNASTNADDLRTIPQGWYPVIAESLTGKDAANLRIEVEGYNYGDETDLFAALAGYDSEGYVFEEATSQKLTVEKGAFSTSFDLESLTDVDTKRIKAFIWDEETYAPYSDHLDYVY